jgi:hypothetical protein
MSTRPRSLRPLVGGAILLPALAVGLAMGTVGGSLAQEATPEAATEGRPAHIHAGNCEEGELGDIVAPLANLTAAEGEGQGQSDLAVGAESSFTSVPLPLDAILADDHAVNVHLSTEEIGTYIACGEIGGTIDPNGSLVIGLKELNDSGFTGIAFLAPGADGASTDVSVFVAEGLGDGGDDDSAAGDTADDAADDDEADVDVDDDDSTPEA